MRRYGNTRFDMYGGALEKEGRAREKRLGSRDIKEQMEDDVGEAKRVEEAQVTRIVDEATQGEDEQALRAKANEPTPYMAEMLQKHAKTCVKVALASMNIVRNNHDTNVTALMIIRSVAAVYAAQHLAPTDLHFFFALVHNLAVEAMHIGTDDPADRLILPAGARG